MEFDSILGFPGEGPSTFAFGSVWALHTLLLMLCCGFLFWSPFSRPCRWTSYAGSKRAGRRLPSMFVLVRRLGVSLWLLLFLFLVSSCRVAAAMPLLPHTSAENRRAREREAGPALRTGRPVTEATVNLRERYWNVFLRWSQEEGYDLGLLHKLPLQCWRDQLFTYKIWTCFIFCRYGVQSVCWSPGCFDSTKIWVTQTLDGCMGLGICLDFQRTFTAPYSTAGTYFAGDDFSLNHVGLATSGRNTGAGFWGPLEARQIGECTPVRLAAAQRFWLRFQSGSQSLGSPMLGNRLQRLTVLIWLKSSTWPFVISSHTANYGLTVLKHHETDFDLSLCWKPWGYPLLVHCLDLGSLRSGGATSIILTTKNGELCRRRGRWANFKMMEVYVQECMALQYTTKVPADVRDHIFCLAGIFLSSFEKARALMQAKIPMHLWYVSLKDALCRKKWAFIVGTVSRQQVDEMLSGELNAAGLAVSDCRSCGHYTIFIHSSSTTTCCLEGKMRVRLNWYIYMVYFIYII